MIRDAERITPLPDGWPLVCLLPRVSYAPEGLPHTPAFRGPDGWFHPHERRLCVDSRSAVGSRISDLPPSAARRDVLQPFMTEAIDMTAVPAATAPLSSPRATDSLVHKQRLIESALDRYTQFPRDCPDKLREAIRYSLLIPGKRLRPML